MLLAKSSFQGDVKNWSTLINLHSELILEVTHYDHTLNALLNSLKQPLRSILEH